MHQSLVPVLLLAIVVAFPQTFGSEDQDIDNTIRNTRLHILNSIYCADPIKSQVTSILCKLLQEKDNNDKGHINDMINKETSYNGVGYRKEQWHNYPRQLDRLHFKDYFKDYNKRNQNPNEPNDDFIDDLNKKDEGMEEYLNEFILGKDFNNGQAPDLDLYSTNNYKDIDEAIYAEELPIVNRLADKAEINQINPFNDVKYKRDSSLSLEKLEFLDDIASKPKQRTIKKRIFSLWSRLQSLSHKGHELQHRRMHAFYGLPESGDGTAILTAETRAGLMRPPGSPLRWG